MVFELTLSIREQFVLQTLDVPGTEDEVKSLIQKKNSAKETWGI